MTRLPRNPKEKEKIGFWLLNPASKLESFLLTSFFLLLPTQFGKHFWPDFTLVSGIQIDYLSPTVYLTDLLLLVLFGFFIFRWFKTQAKLKVKSKNLLLVLGIFLFFCLNVVFSARSLLGVYGIVKLLEFAFLSLYLVKTISSKVQLQQITLLFAISATFESLLAIFQYLNQGSLNGIFYFFGERTFTGNTPGIANASINGALILRPYATFSHPNVLAGYLLVAMILIWNFLLYAKARWMRLAATISLLASSIALLLTFSRVAILLWILFVFTLLLRMLFRTIKTRRARIVSLLVAVLVLFFLSFFPLTRELYSRFSSTSLADESITQRAELLFSSWILIQHHPLFGVGLDNFIPALAPLQKPLPLGLYLQPVHNIFVLVATEMGIIGLSLFILLLTITMIRLKKQESGSKGIFFVLLLLIFVTGFFDHYWLTLQQGQLLFATVIGLSLANLQEAA